MITANAPFKPADRRTILRGGKPLRSRVRQVIHHHANLRRRLIVVKGGRALAGSGEEASGDVGRGVGVHSLGRRYMPRGIEGVLV